MNKFIFGFLFCTSFLLATFVFAQNSDQSSSDSGVLVSPPINAQVSGKNNSDNNGSILVQDSSNQGISNNAGQSNKPKNADQSKSVPVDQIDVKATDFIMSQITANMKLTDDQLSVVRMIVQDNVVQARKLQLSVENGAMDSKTMSQQIIQLTNDENKKLGKVLTSDQMKAWINIQNPYQT